MRNRAYAPIAVVIFGVSTPFSYWVFQLVHRIVEAITGPTLRLHVGSLRQLREGFDQRDGRSVVITTDLPEAELTRFICASRLPILAVADDVVDNLAWAQVSRQINVYDAARFCTHMLSALAPAFLLSHSLIVDGRHGDSAEQIITAVIDYLFPLRSEGVTQQVFEHLSKGGPVAPDVFVDRAGFHAEMGRAEDVIREKYEASLVALSAYAEIFARRWPSYIDWPMGLFRGADELPPSSAIDLTGPARALLFGPYLHLPVGEWMAKVEFEISEAHSGFEAVADVRVQQTITKKTLIAPAKGIFAYDLVFRVDDPAHDLEIRLFMTKGAIEGVFIPRSVRVRPAATAPEAV
jgi:hypothetical protein